MTPSDIDHLFDRWFSGSLSPEEEAYLLERVENCAICAVAYEAATREFTAIATVLEPKTPSPKLRKRILDDLATSNRFEDLAAQVAQLIDRSLEFAVDLVGRIDLPSSWEEAPFPGVELFHIDGGPAVEDAIVGFIRIEPAGMFPEHRHHGKEYLLVLQGGFQDDSGNVYRRGDLCVSDSDTIHDLTALSNGPPLIYLVVLHNGLDIVGMFIGPGDARM
ncbi:MAG: cupin domain-containing protein [Bradymonadaceae bacterium]|nr:cupin domain-containing protein [Lujinxingiaceae bacterium]